MFTGHFHISVVQCHLSRYRWYYTEGITSGVGKALCNGGGYSFEISPSPPLALSDIEETGRNSENLSYVFDTHVTIRFRKTTDTYRYAYI